MQGGGREFEPRWVHQPRRAAYISAISSIGRAFGLHPKGFVGSSPTLRTSSPTLDLKSCKFYDLAYKNHRCVLLIVPLPKRETIVGDAARGPAVRKCDFYIV